MRTVAGKQSVPGEQRRGETPGEPVSPMPMDANNLLLNRELSLIEFFRRVLEEAQDETQPILERLKFLTIFSQNLDEFFMIRVSGLKETLDEKVTELSPDGMTQADQLAQIRERLVPIVDEQMRCLREDVLPQLQAQGVHLVSYYNLSGRERKALDQYFEERIYPLLTPQGVDPGHPFPYISNVSLNIGLMVEPIPEHGITRSLVGKVEPRFVRIKLPPSVPRLIPVGDDAEAKFILLEELIAANAGIIFPRMRVGQFHTFRVTRDADIEIREEEAADLLQMMQQNLHQRRFGTPVRLEVAATMPGEMVSYLTESIGLTPEDVYSVNGPLNIPDLMALYKLDRPELKDRPIRPRIPEALRGAEDIFEAIQQQDILLHHPYDSYDVVTDFIDRAARDPKVVAIKICLYRTGQDSPIPQALIAASEQGKQVTALVELKARFDEENNIEWAQQLVQSGVHVVYGLVGLKTHSKVALVVRQEDDTLRRYVHIATGNYNPTTSRFYTDLGLLTAHEEIGADATDLFNYLTGYSRQKVYRQFMVAPVNLRERMMGLIEREIEHARAGRTARIGAKFNRLADLKIIDALYEASRAGVRIDLVVRGICMLRPGVAGLSENISVRSIVGRFLEHSRIYHFANGGNDEVYIGSSDWMPRNLDRRVEVITPVHDPRLRSYLKDVVLANYLRDNVKARRLLPDGTYERVKPAPDEERIDSQMYFAEVQQ